MIGFAVLCLGFAAITAWAMYPRSTTTCNVDEAKETLDAARLIVDELTVLEGCTRVVTGLRSGEVRSAVAVGTEEAILDALNVANVDTSRASSSFMDAVGLPDSFDVREIPIGGTWREGDRLNFRDRVDFRDRPWGRYVSWGQEHDGEDFMIGIILEVGSL